MPRVLRLRDHEIALGVTVLAFIPPLAALGGEFGDLPRRPADALAVLLVLGQTVPLAVRGRWPALCLAVTGIAFAVHESMGYPQNIAAIGLYIALYSVGSLQNRHRMALAIAATAAYVAFAAVLAWLGSPDRMLDSAVFYVALAAWWLLGAFVRRRRQDEVERRRLAELAAAADERARIARELHDVVTHHVTAMVVQADAAQFVSEPAEALTAISGSGRLALRELRHLLDVLEATGAAGTVAELVEQTRAGGQPVELIEDGDRGSVNPGVELALYRVVQEALTNAVKYAAGSRTVVRVGRTPDAVDVEVTTAESRLHPEAQGGGRGLDGLRERVAKVGGSLEAGPRADGGFVVSARIPTGSG
ncbi:sensor kinase [Kutzneria sp. CA-103260]|nr:sensor kinase [Kutzneria sp. CA-103260]